MSDTSQPYDCSALELNLHLIIGGDLDPTDQARAQEHLSSCTACQLLAERASEMRQLYFEAGGRATAEPVDLWGAIRDTLRTEGAFAGAEPIASSNGSSGAQASGPEGDEDPVSVPRKPAAANFATAEFANAAERDPAREFLDARDSGSQVPLTSHRAWKGSEHRAVLGVLAGAAAATLLIFLKPDPVEQALSVTASSGPIASSEEAGGLAPATGRVAIGGEPAGAPEDPASRGLHAISPYSQSERLALQGVLYNSQPGFLPNAGAPQGAERLASFQSTGVELR